MALKAIYLGRVGDQYVMFACDPGVEPEDVLEKLVGAPDDPKAFWFSADDWRDYQSSAEARDTRFRFFIAPFEGDVGEEIEDHTGVLIEYEPPT